jgi:hypothetical protein
LHELLGDTCRRGFEHLCPPDTIQAPSRPFLLGFLRDFLNLFAEPSGFDSPPRHASFCAVCVESARFFAIGPFEEIVSAVHNLMPFARRSSSFDARSSWRRDYETRRVSIETVDAFAGHPERDHTQGWRSFSSRIACCAANTRRGGAPTVPWFK